ncbi:MAG: hypothetical protein OPY03_01815 [Nitrosopumilus sp.]|nr:hypothetical protein [Nitrosopumilus sp.]
MYLNANIPPIECYVRGNYLRNQQDSHDKIYPCLVFGVTSIPNNAVLFNILMEDGGIFWRLPVSALCWKECKEVDLGDLELWDSFSYDIAVTTFYTLEHKRVEYMDRHGTLRKGEYVFTLDWSNGDYNSLRFGFAEEAGQHKAGHVLKLDDGSFAIQPNNRLKMFDPSFAVKKEMVCERLLNSHKWSVEKTSKFITEDSDKYDYDVIITTEKGNEK